MRMLAEADALLGQLQRGRGAGFRRALRESPQSVYPLLIECVTHDPRWDRQVEPRAEYYAALGVQIALPLDSFEPHLRQVADTEPADPNDLVLNTLCALAERHYAPAITVLRSYLAYGDFWDMAFEALYAGWDKASATEEVSQLIDTRFADDEALDDALRWAVVAQRQPWNALRLINPRVERILAAHEVEEAHRHQHQQQAHADLASLSAHQILTAEIDHTTARPAALILQGRVTTADLDLLVHTAQHGTRWQRYVAFRGLERLAHPGAFSTLRTFFESPDEHPGFLYGAALRAIRALPADVTLDLARAWFDDPAGPHRHVALQILKDHATADDVPRVRAALLPSLRRDTPDTNECYMQCSMLEILARFPECGPYPEAEVVFQEAGYSRTRVYAADVLAASDESFSRGLAVECLWDCEERVREIGCEGVDVRLPDAFARVQAIARDPHEDEEVRDVAQGRLADLEDRPPR